MENQLLKSYLVSLVYGIASLATSYLVFYKNYFIIVQLQLSAFTPHHCPANPSQAHLPSLLPHPLDYVHLSFIVVPENPSPLPPIISSHLPSGYSQIVLNFNICGYIFLAYLFC